MIRPALLLSYRPALAAVIAAFIPLTVPTVAIAQMAVALAHTTVDREDGVLLDIHAQAFSCKKPQLVFTVVTVNESGGDSPRSYAYIEDSDGQLSRLSLVGGKYRSGTTALLLPQGLVAEPGAAKATLLKNGKAVGSDCENIYLGMEDADKLLKRVTGLATNRTRPIAGSSADAHGKGVKQVTAAAARPSRGGNASGTVQPSGPAERVQVSDAAQAAKLIDAPTPTYPRLARQARVQGAVRFRVVIDASGAVQEAVLVSGHPLLVPAAIETVKQYRYKQTMKNGRPVEVSTEIEVKFALP